jgi:hypothetical protein
MEEPDKQELTSLIIDGPPWEKKHELGFFLAFFETLKAFLLHPAHTFSVMRRSNGFGDALIYTVAIQVFTFLWMFTLTNPNPEMIFQQFPELEGVVDLPPNFAQIMVLIYPISVMLLQFIASLGLHFALKFRDLQTYDFSLIFRITAYAAGTASLLVILPAIGGLLSFAMTLYLVFVGLRTIYGLDIGSFVITALLTAVIMVGLYIGVVLGFTVLVVILSILL